MMAEKTRLHVPINDVLTVVHPETEIDQIIGLARQNSTAYAVGNIAFVGSLTVNGIFLKCISAGTTAFTEPSFSGAAVGGTVTDGTVVWQYYDLLSGSGVPLGSILPYSANAQTPPYGFLFFEGQAVSRTMYADYFDLVGTAYGEGDGENTFNLPNLIDAAMLNGSYTKTSYTTAGSATFTAPKTGWYKITVKGGGGGGAGGYKNTGSQTIAYYNGGAGGGEGGTTFAWEHLNAGDTVSVVIGAGGAGGAANGGAGGDGGDSTATIDLTTITGGGGSGGGVYTTMTAGAGGSGTILGTPGQSGQYFAITNNSSTNGANGGAGGGEGGGTAGRNNPTDGTNGGGGGGGSANNASAGGNGGDGYATIEYIGISMKYIGKVYDAPTPSSAQIDLSQYVADLARRLTREQTPAFNKRDVITTSGTYTAPVTGWYKITVKGGGGGGGGAYASSNVNYCYGGGGEGGLTIGYEKLTAGQTVAVVIGAGGAGGTGNAVGNDGGNTTVTINNNSYTGGGGKGGGLYGGLGGTGTIPGAAGGASNNESGQVNTSTMVGGNGGGNGGGTITADGTLGGGGGAGLFIAPSTASGGGKGGDGYATFEYFDGSLN